MHSVIGDPEATQTKRLPPALSVGRAPVPELGTVSSSIPPPPSVHRGAAARGGAEAEGRSGGASPRPSSMPFSLCLSRPPHPPWHLGHLLPRAPALSSFLPISHPGALKIRFRLTARHPTNSRGSGHALGDLDQLTEGSRREARPRPAALNFSPGRCAGLGAGGRERGAPFPLDCPRPSGDLGQSLHLASLSLPTDAWAPRH